MKITPRQYAELLYRMIEGKEESVLPATLRAFVEFLIENRALGKVPKIFSSFKEVWVKRTGEQSVYVTVARTFNEKEIAGLHTKLGKIVEVSVDPTLLGGARIRRGDWIWDGSLRATLNKLNESLQAG